MRALISALLAMTMLSGCYTAKLYSRHETEGRRTEVRQTWTLFWGLAPLTEVNMDKYCGGKPGIAEIQTFVGGPAVLVYWLTAGIVTPIRVRFTCQRAGRGEAEGDALGFMDLAEPTPILPEPLE